MSIDQRLPVGTPEALRRRAEEMVPFSLDLAGCPLVLPYSDRPKPGPDGGLPLARTRAIRDWELPNGLAGRIETTGHPVLGLPFGTDADFLVAVMKSLHEIGSTDGILSDVTLRDVASTFELSGGGSSTNRLKEAALRLAHVRIQTDILYQPEQMDLDEWLDEHLFLQIDRTDPRLRLLETETLHVFHLRTNRPILEDTGAPAGDFLIREIQFHPLWVSQVNSGWVAWLDLEIYRNLPRGMVRRLYLFLAHLASAEWQRKKFWAIREEDLFSVLGYPREEWGSVPRKHLVRNLRVLMREGVLVGPWKKGETQTGRARRGYVYHLEPGRALRPTIQLAGLPGIARLPVRALVMQLRHWQVPDADITTWIRDSFQRLSYAVARVNYLREPRHGDGRTVNNPGAFIRAALDENYNFQSDPHFRRWLEYDGVPPDLPAEVRTPMAQDHSSPPPKPPPSGKDEPLLTPPAAKGTVEARKHYDLLLGRLNEEGHAGSAMASFVLKGTTPMRIEDDTLVLSASAGAQALESEVSAIFNRILSSMDGPVRHLRLVVNE